MFDYKPERSSETLNYDAIGSLSSDFEAFKPNPKYSWDNRIKPENYDAWPIIKSVTAPKIGKKLPQIIQNVVDMTWKFAEPSQNAQRGNIIMGARGGVAPAAIQQTYNPHVRPVHNPLPTATPNKSAIAADWKVFEQIKRTNAVTFRGDTRPPREVINEMGGFTPPNTRTDRFYLENGIYNAFNDYLQRRYNRPLAKADFLRAVDAAAPSPADKNVLIDYMMWRKITEKEAMHLGRMVENECLKGYISTSRSIDSSITFGTKYLKQEGWIYVTVVLGGFVVPWGLKANWGSKEAEIAQWGPIPAQRIVGFVGITNLGIPRTPIYMRRSFRKNENTAFEYMFNVMSGMTP